MLKATGLYFNLDFLVLRNTAFAVILVFAMIGCGSKGNSVDAAASTTTGTIGAPLYPVVTPLIGFQSTLHFCWYFTFTDSDRAGSCRRRNCKNLF
jgi:hypothetical protein